jgi:hypothetical protein
MPRTASAFVGGIWYHVLNRGNRRESVFHKPGDYDAFVEAIVDGGARLPARVLSDAAPFSPVDPFPRRRRLGPMGTGIFDSP